MNGKEVLEYESTNLVDVILLDITMPIIDGLEVMERLFNKNSHSKILVLSGHTEGWVIEKSIKLGAAGYLTKRVDMNEIITAITTVYNGDNYIDESSLSVILQTNGAKGGI